MKWWGVPLALVLVSGCSGGDHEQTLDVGDGSEQTAPYVPGSALPSALPKPTLSPLPVKRSPLPLPRPPRPTTTSTPTNPGSSVVWRDSSDGWTVTTRRDVAKPKAGQLVRFEVTVVPPRSGAYHVGVLWGDNMGSDNPIASDCGTGPKASAGRSFTVGFAHAWRVSRTYSVTVQPGVGCEAGKAPAYPKHTVAVTTGRVRGNGPQAPWGRVDYGPKDTGDAAADHYFSAQGTDNDGYVARLVFDWGDGSKATTVDFVSGCRRPPDDSWIEYPNSVNDVHHKYAKAPSSYTITMTVVSSGCRGEDEQRMAVRWRPTRTEVGPYSSPEPRA